jgi:hypothetical protein
MSSKSRICPKTGMKYKIKFYLCSFNKNKDYGFVQVILDAEDMFRDILADDTLEDLHNAIFNSFGFV